MTRPKAHFSGTNEPFSITGPRDFSTSLQDSLRKHCPPDAKTNGENTCRRVTAFVGAVLSEAWWAKSKLHTNKANLSTADIRAEFDDLSKSIEETRDKLRTISPDVDRLLGTSADPLGCADALDTLLTEMKRRQPELKRNGRKLRMREITRHVALELAIRVLRVFKDYGGRITTTPYASKRGESNPAIALLIGADIGLVLSVTTWRDVISRAFKEAPDLRSL